MNSGKTKVLVLFGTRPEAIKMAPVLLELKRNPKKFTVATCVTGQHRLMLDQVMEFFDLTAEYDLNLMKPNQSLSGLTSDIILNLGPVLQDFMPDIVLVHGDTTTSFVGALAAFYHGCKVGHVEAGLRTYLKKAPYPEEINRQLTARITDVHFAPTSKASENLRNESLLEADIVVTGNTVIDALYESVELLKSYNSEIITVINQKLSGFEKMILVTGHRRENHGDGFVRICEALDEIASLHPNVLIVYPVHLNPKVQEPVKRFLSDRSNILLINPASYPDFVWLMNRANLIITDSGGVQEEAPSLGKPVLVLRDVTERPEAVEAGTVRLVGTDKDKIVSETIKLLTDNLYYSSMSRAHNPYGDGKASSRIVEYLRSI